MGAAGDADRQLDVAAGPRRLDQGLYSYEQCRLLKAKAEMRVSPGNFASRPVADIGGYLKLQTMPGQETRCA